jgi:thioredoxin 1
MDSILLRLALAVVITLAGLLVYAGYRRLQLARLRRPMVGLEDWRGGIPAILYFTTPTCIPCKTQQRPALKRLVDEYNVEVQIIQVDATEQPKVADYWGVLTVPTTFVINSHGEARAMNPGVASAEKLLAQLQEAEGDRLRSARRASKPDAATHVEYKGSTP